MISPNLKVGRLPFLVCAPFFHSSLEGHGGVDFIDGVPSFLNHELQSGRIDCAPSSSFEYGLHFSQYRLLPHISTSSRLEIQSVLFLSQRPWSEMDGRTVRLSPDSATSNVLFQILSKKRFFIEPKIISESNSISASGNISTQGEILARENSAEGQVFIGDKALQASISGQWAYRYDLAEVWREWQGLPFSFGLWIVHEQAVENKNEILKNLQKSIHLSISEFRGNPEKALRHWVKYYPTSLPWDIMLKFYESADYSFSADHEKSLQLFFALAYEMKFLPLLPKLQYLT